MNDLFTHFEFNRLEEELKQKNNTQLFTWYVIKKAILEIEANMKLSSEANSPRNETTLCNDCT